MTKQKYPCKHKGERVLLVEGKNDCHAVFAYAKNLRFRKPSAF